MKLAYISRREGTEISERTGVQADDSYHGRRPTSHERLAGRPWDASYRDRPPPWDIGRPQPAIVRVAGEQSFAGAVLDAGCGTGENALYVASLGLRVVGVDVAETAVSTAREKAAARGIDADFVVADALHLDRLGRDFETVLDCGLFHSFDSGERQDYVASLGSVTRRGGVLYVLCFSDVGPDIGPHPVSQGQLRTAFEPSGGWTLVSVTSGSGRDEDARARCAGVVGQGRTNLVTESRPRWLSRRGSQCETRFDRRAWPRRSAPHARRAGGASRGRARRLVARPPA